ncbi:MAG TPA: glycosyltransferase family 2 protein [Anaerolineales bacterium]|nr:glycosyltransferase family 2 protein [Anaerolineales bacterium]HLO30379.1 glycosyltransferase family 2 protein [Anaerolineales bacterium]
MDSLPRITVITPSFNQGDFIEQTINSVLSQKYPDLEYIVMDGGSTDNTLEILKKYDGRLLWISEKDRGQSHAINKGLRIATGEIIAFLNSDDLYEPDSLWKVGTFFTTYPDTNWLSGKCRTIDSRGKEIRKGITLYKNAWLRLRSYGVLAVLNYISQPATFWSRKVIGTIGDFDESLRYAMDYDYWLRIGGKFKLWVLDDYLACFRIHASSKAGSSANAQFEAEFQIAKRYITSPVLVWLHTTHVALTVSIYRKLMSSHQLAAPFESQK